MADVATGRRLIAELLQQWAKHHTDDGLNDIKDHAPLLRRLALECKNITEFGVRNGISTGAFLSGIPEKIRCYDIDRRPNMDMLKYVAEQMAVDFEFIQTDTTQALIDETDLLFIDACHRYSHVSKELKNASRVRKYIVFHDTVQCWQWEEGNPVKVEGIGRAIQELLDKGEWFISSDYRTGSGLMVLARK
jgi:predicted O-methyltransferase YrrM